LGRLASFVAKKALEGESIVIVNAEKAIITGNEEDIKERYKTRRDVGDRYKGPFFPRMPDRIVRRAIRGMLPYKTRRGRDAYKRVKVYIGVPKELEGKDIKKLEWTKDKLKHQKFIYVEELSRWLGARW
jgi:large subunit ribosomal protein L13